MSGFMPVGHDPRDEVRQDVQDQQANADQQDRFLNSGRRPSIDESDESDPLAGYRSDRSNSLGFGSYFSTFGERGRALGGGLGGFFGALGGQGMRTANDLLAGRNRSAAEKYFVQRKPAPILSNRLANEGQAQAPGVDNSLGFGNYFSTFGRRSRALGGGLSGFFGALRGQGMRRANQAGQRSLLAAYPREPGVEYDEGRAVAARRAFAQRRDILQGTSRPTEMQARATMNTHAVYDSWTGNRSMPLNADPYKFSNDKFNAIMKANEKWAADSAEVDMAGTSAAGSGIAEAPKRARRVRFQDGANDEVGQSGGPDVSAREAKKPIRPTGQRNIPLEVTLDTPQKAPGTGKATPEFPTENLSGANKSRVAAHLAEGTSESIDPESIGPKLGKDFFKDSYFSSYERGVAEIQDRPRKEAQARVREMFMQRPPLLPPGRMRFHEEVPFSPEFQDKQARRDVWAELQQARGFGGSSQPAEETGFWAGGKRFNEGDEIDGYKALGKWDWDQKPPVFDALEHQAPLDDKGNLIGAEPASVPSAHQYGDEGQSRDSSDSSESESDAFNPGTDDFIKRLLA